MHKEISELTELDLPATLLFDYPSTSELISFILSTLPPPATRPAVASQATAATAISPPTMAAITEVSRLGMGVLPANEPARPVWWYMLEPQRAAWALDLVKSIVEKVLGKELDASQPLMMAGLDSLGVSSPQPAACPTMRFGSTAKVLLKCKLKYYKISECDKHSHVFQGVEIWAESVWYAE